MTLPARHASPLLACFALAASAGSILSGPCLAGEYGSQFVTNATRCSAAYGPEFTAVEGSDACARIGGHVRVQLGSNAGLRSEDGWSRGKASSATLHPGGDEPRAGTPTHLRIQGGLEYPNPFR